MAINFNPQDLINKYKGLLSSGIKTVINREKRGYEITRDYFRPTGNDGMNIWNTKAAQSMANAQRFIESPKQLAPIPQVNVFKGNTPVTRTLATGGNMIANLPGSIANTLSQGFTAPLFDVGQAIGRPFSGRQYEYEQFKNIGRLGLQLGGIINPNVRKTQGTKYGFKQVAGNLAETSLPILSAYLPKGVEAPGFISGAKSGAKFGGAFGLLEALTSGRNIENNAEYGLHLAEGTGGGMIAGTVLGGAFGGLTSVYNKLFRNVVIEKPGTKSWEKQLRDNGGKWTAGETPKKPPKMPQKAWEFQLQFNEKYGRNPYSPVYQSDINKAFKIEADKRAGMSVRDVNADKIPDPEGFKKKATGSGAQGKLYNVEYAKKVLQDGVFSEHEIKGLQGLDPKYNPHGLPQEVWKQASKEIGFKPENLVKSTDGKFYLKDAQAGLSVKERGFTTSVQEAPNISKTTKAGVEGIYTPKPNIDLMGEAKALLEEGASIKIKSVENIDKKVAATIQEAINLDKEGNSQAAANLYNNLAETGTELGRGVQAFSLLQRMSPEAISLSVAGRIKRYNANAGGLTGRKLVPELTGKQQKQISDMVAQMDGLTGKEKNIAIFQLNKKIDEFIPSTLVDKAITLWKAGLLTSLRTHERNIVGNTGMGTAEIGASAIASPVDRILAIKTGQRTLTFTGKGTVSGAGKGVVGAKNYLRTGFDPENSISKYDIRQTNFGKGKLGKLAKGYTDIVFRTLGAADKPFWSASFGRSLYDQAGATAINAGKQGDGAFIENLVKNPTDDMLRIATQDANYSTFRDENMLTSFASAIKRVARKNEFAKLVTEGLIPFTGVPSSIVGKTLSYSPLGLIKGSVDAMRVVFGKGVMPELQRQASQEVGRGVMGTALFAIGAWLMKKGLMTGRPKDQKEAREWKLQNKPYNSVMIGKWRSINSIGPQQLVMLAGAKYQEFRDDPDRGMGAYGLELGRDQLSQTFLSGVQQPLQAINDPTRYGESYVGNLTSSVIPNISKDASKAFDPYQRETNSVLDYSKKSLPGVRNTMLPKRDALGNIMPQEPTGISAFIDLFNSKDPKTSALIEELVRVDATPGDLTKKQTIRGEKRDLIPSELNALKAEVGPILQQKLEELISSSGYQKLTDEDKKKAIQSAVTKVRKNVRGQTSLGGMSDEVIKTNNGTSYIYYDVAGDMKTLDTTKVMNMPTETNYERALQEKEAFKLVDDILDNLDPDEQEQALSQIGISLEDAEYYNVARQVNDIKYIAVTDIISGIDNKADLLEMLAQGRREVNGKMLVANGVVDDLYNDNVITFDERKFLKNLEWDKETGEVIAKKSTAKPKKITIKQISIPKIAAPKSSIKKVTVKRPERVTKKYTLRGVTTPKIKEAKIKGWTVKTDYKYTTVKTGA